MGIDGTTTPLLGGVEFKLEKLNDDNTAETIDTCMTSSEGADKGKCSFASLIPGSYRLTETKTAEGYTLLAEPVEFTLTADGQCLRDGVAFGAKTTDADGVCNIALTIYNRKGFTLPHTGADAPSLWLLIGLPALVAVLLVLVFLMPYAALIPMPTIAAILLQVATTCRLRNFAHLCATASRAPWPRCC